MREKERVGIVELRESVGIVKWRDLFNCKLDPKLNMREFP